MAKNEVQDIQANKELFIKMFTNYVDRPGVDKLLEMLDRTDFYESPASTRYHLSVKGGNCKHSLNVIISMLEQAQLMSTIMNLEGFSLLERAKTGEPFTEEEKEDLDTLISTVFNSKKVKLDSIIVSGGCHDFHKINLYESYVKKLPDENGDWKPQEFWKRREDAFILGGDGSNSCYVANSCIKLTYEEQLAIENHMGMDHRGNALPASSGAWTTSRLALYLHVADLISTFHFEQ